MQRVSVAHNKFGVPSMSSILIAASVSPDDIRRARSQMNSMAPDQLNGNEQRSVLNNMILPF